MSMVAEQTLYLDEFYAHARTKGRLAQYPGCRIVKTHRREHLDGKNKPDCCSLEVIHEGHRVLVPICPWEEYRKFLTGQIVLTQIQML